MRDRVLEQAPEFSLGVLQPPRSTAGTTFTPLSSEPQRTTLSPSTWHHAMSPIKREKTEKEEADHVGRDPITTDDRPRTPLSLSKLLP